MKYPRLETAARQAIDNAKANDRALLTHISGYKTKFDFLILKDMLNYASDQNVQVIFIPNEQKNNSKRFPQKLAKRSN